MSDEIRDGGSEVVSEPQSVLGKALESLRKQDKEGLTKHLTEMNMRLTGHRGAHFQNDDDLEQPLDKLFKDIKKHGWGDEVIYLGDGGYSRLLVGSDDTHGAYIDISEVSLKEAKEKWQTIQEEYKNLDKLKK